MWSTREEECQALGKIISKENWCTHLLADCHTLLHSWSMSHHFTLLSLCWWRTRSTGVHIKCLLGVRCWVLWCRSIPMTSHCKHFCVMWLIFFSHQYLFDWENWASNSLFSHFHQIGQDIFHQCSGCPCHHCCPCPSVQQTTFCLDNYILNIG